MFIFAVHAIRSRGLTQLQKFEDNKTEALKVQAKHEIAQLYFNDKFYYYMHAHMTEVASIRQNVEFMEESKRTVGQLIKYAKMVEESEQELINFNFSDSQNNSSNHTAQNTTKRRLLTLDAKKLNNIYRRAHMQVSNTSSNDTNTSSNDNASLKIEAELNQHDYVDMYKKYAAQIKDNKPLVEQLDGSLNDFAASQDNFLDGISNNYHFSDVIDDLRSEYEERILNFLFENNLMEAYEVDEQHLWLLGWLLESKDQFLSWLKTPKDQISSLSQLSKVNKTELSILNDYLDDLIDEVVEREIRNKVDNARFAFHIYRGLKFNITDITNVTNCTNKEVHCPCEPGRDPANHTYCDLVPNTTNQTTNPTDQNKTSITKRILATNTTNNTSNTSATNKSLNTTAQNDSKPAANDLPVAAAGVPKKQASPFKSTKRVSLVPDEAIVDEFFVLTPYTVLCNLQIKLVNEKGIAGFLTAFKFIMSQYLYNELEHGYDKQTVPTDLA